MVHSAVACPKCKQQMQEGFVVDRFDRWTALAGRWSEGRPETGWFGAWGGVKLRGRKRLPIAAYRCTSCGYLECYAK